MKARSHIAIVPLALVIASWGCGDNDKNCSSGQACWKDGGADVRFGGDAGTDLWGPSLDASRDSQSQIDVGSEVAIVDLGAATGPDLATLDVGTPDSTTSDTLAVDALPTDAPSADALPADAPSGNTLPRDLGTTDAPSPKEVADFRDTASDSSNANLQGLALTAGILSPSFNASTTSYIVSIPTNVSSIAITPTAATTAASITINGQPVILSQISSAIPLNYGINTITVTVTAPDSTTTKTYTITITRAEPFSSNANLQGLALSAGTLSPSFEASTTTYSASVDNAISSVAITPTAEKAEAGITVNGQRVVSGHASANIPLIVGSNTITVYVTAPDSVTGKTYTVTITRAEPLSTNANLQGLTISAGTLSPSFDVSTTFYSASVANAISSVAITPIAAKIEASIVVNELTTVSSQASTSIALNVGSNTITVTVTAPDLTTTRTYTITITRAEPVSTNANLQGLTVSAGILSPSFDASTTSYSASVANAISSVTITPTSADPSAGIVVNELTAISSQASTDIALNVGSNTITVIVTAPDLTTTKTYTVTITRAEPLSTNASLQELTISAGTLSPSFDASTTSYSAAVANAISSTTVTPTAEKAEASITVNGQAVTSGQASSSLSLNVGSNTITVIVTAPDLTTTQTYTVTITRAEPLSTNANLQGLTISSGTLSPSFDASTTSYSASVANAISSATITPTAEMTETSITVNGQAVTSGQASSNLSLNFGSNTITVIVTAPDLTTTKTYTVTITRAAPPSSNANLSSLTISPGTLSPGFDSSITAYTASVDSLTGYVFITPTRSDPGATITVNSTAVASGTSTTVNLTPGENTITIIVTAEDTSTTKTTTVIVNKDLTCEDILDPVSCTRANCEWADGTCIYPNTNHTCDAYDEADCLQAEPECMWIGICIFNEG